MNGIEEKQEVRWKEERWWLETVECLELNYRRTVTFGTSAWLQEATTQ